MRGKRDEKLKKALEAIASGLGYNGKPINLALIAAEAYTSTQKFAREIRLCEAITRRKLYGARYKG
ncbi:MAG: hypothetical protein A2528_01195 [Candidatus Staskawiczbacteria bacterium RIFOXYD2_FULL_37_9]|uniref:Uncharacterized protein n=1 Tax=Candidatus Staskawiczbacteria bacterium RIFOXYB1_FULL_37_44 TaxID=1802223 RepID=A0A1G2IWL7_9BACT|nr:MAG: hypothetical protein A2358_04600 [Candidatus Staskawiczbacteria bacterium RIFOXYB1_FULL_37_44]OGZ89556.1 MAG: hypothetical protein A2581_03810 [Candidatus Staskawiczbacteria bacterium RIFOXYD1_FULL_37_110]OGZ92925.1 MAG: hypothetical protein A2528_01195 [Candidatus Staskawiczbacteria bacterium RIFOXYD2_FULL_37_9]